MKKKILLFGLAALLLTGCGKADGRIRFGAAGLGGVYQTFASAFTQIASEEDEDTEYEVKTTAGSAANIRLLSEEYIELAIAQADIAKDAYYGTGDFEDSSYQGYGAVAGLYTEACQIVVREDSGITELSQLLGKTVSIGEEESGTAKNATQILNAAGLSDGLVNMVNRTYAQAASDLQSGKIDALFCTAGVQTTVIEELAESCTIAFLPVDETCREKLDLLYGAYTEYVIPAGTYTGQTEDIETVGVQALLLASDELSVDTVQTLTDLLFERQEDLQYSMSVDLSLDESSAAAMPIPLHAGAEAYYKEKGISVD